MRERIMNYELRIKEKGFSLLETLVALAILTAAVTGPMNLATVSIRSASLAHNNITASFLAEEGMELVRARRDAMAYTGQDWLADIGVCTVAAPCIADVFASATTDIIRPCSGACPKLKYDSATGVFSQPATGADSIFTRTVSVDTAAPFNSAREAQVTVTVSWKERFLPNLQTVIIATNLSNWK
jgi:prepilin-type N-terminal cleavage/methylation domain-containing protein